MIDSSRALAALLAALLCLAAPARAQDAAGTAAAPRPNIVLLLIDDAGLTDLGPYGGEARTPHIADLAARGVMFSGYHTSPLCSPSRAMLLTGMDNHRTGVATIPEVLPPEQRGKPGYSMHLEPGVSTVAARLQDAGYRTYMTGKWHLGDGPGQLPDAHGFSRSFALDASGADNWEQKPYMPYYTHAPWYEDGKPAQLPQPFYSSDFLVGRMVDYIESERASPQPFFAYVAFQAVHIPVQAPRELSAPYEAVYRDGWDRLRTDRHRRAQDLGLVPAGAPLGSMAPGTRRWDSLSGAERELASASMAVHAGMLEAMDGALGRLIAYLRESGQLANTVFVISSDNGPEPSDPVAAPGFSSWLQLNGYSREPQTLGARGSFVFIGPEWASATASPSALYKFYASEGGLRAPLIVSGPGLRNGARADGLAFVTDVTPTLLELAGLETAPELDGRSLVPVLQGRRERTYGDEDSVGIEVSGNSALFRGSYKLLRNGPPLGDNEWHLYDLARDPGETRDLREAEPLLFGQLQAAYREYATRNGVLEMPPGYNSQTQVAVNTLWRMLNRYRLELLAVLLCLTGALGYGIYRWRMPRAP